MTQSEAGPASFVERARSLLTTREIGRTIEAFDVVSSTNTLAAERIERGAPHGAVVVAEFQTQGRGRLGRTWSATSGLNLTFSVVLRPELAPERIGLLTIAGGIGVSNAIDRFVAPLRTVIKWPNDIVLNGRKTCGMLLEASWNEPGAHPAVVLGVGLNVNQDAFPPELDDIATSLLLETGRIIPRADLFATVLAEMEDALVEMLSDDEKVRCRYVERMMDVGERIRLRFTATDREVTGIVRGIDASGGLILETRDGRRIFYAGEVTRAAQSDG